MLVAFIFIFVVAFVCIAAWLLAVIFSLVITVLSMAGLLFCYLGELLALLFTFKKRRKAHDTPYKIH